MAAAFSSGSLCASRLEMAAAFLIFARFWIMTGWIGVPVMGKFRFARRDCTP